MTTYKTGRTYDAEQVLQFEIGTKPDWATWIESDTGTYFTDESRHIKGFIPAVCESGEEVLTHYDNGNYI